MNEYVGMDINFLGLYDIQVRSYDNISDVNVIFGEYKSNFIVKDLGDKTYNIDFTFDMAGKSLTGNISNSYKNIDSNKTENSLSVNINVEDKMFNFNTNYVQSIGETIADVDVSNSVDYESITEEEMNEIYSKILAKLQDSKIYNFINTISENFYNDDVDYEFDTDYPAIDDNINYPDNFNIDDYYDNMDINSDFSFEY